MLKMPCPISSLISNTLQLPSILSSSQMAFFFQEHPLPPPPHKTPSPLVAQGFPPLTHWAASFGMVACSYKLWAAGCPHWCLYPQPVFHFSSCLTTSLATPMAEVSACSTVGQPLSNAGHQRGSF